MISTQKIKKGQLDEVLSSDSADYTAATLPLAGTEFALVEQGGTFKKVAVSEFGGGGGGEFLLDTFTFPAQRYNTINVWRSPFPSYQALDDDYLQSYGSATTPNSNFSIQGQWFPVPDGYIVDKIELNINYKLDGGTSSVMQVYVLKSEVDFGYINTAVFNEQVLVNESVTLNAGSTFIKFSKNLTVASNTLPTLNKMHLRFATRETLATDIYYSLNFKVKYKKV